MNKMKFYQLIEQQYKDYKIEDYKKCKKCPCETLRNKMFETHKLRQKCSIEMMTLIFALRNHGYNVGNIDTFSCKDCRIASLEIAKKLFEKKEFNKI